MASRFVLPNADVGSGISPSDGAKLEFFDSGTSTQKDTFSDEALTIKNANPVIANGDGVFPDIFLDGGFYKVTLKNKNNVGTGFIEADPVTGDAVQTYNQGGTGAVDRTVELKLQESESVKDFGAVGDGVADDSAEVLLAEADLDASIGGLLKLTNGNYLNAPFPSSDQITQRYDGPNILSNVFQESGETTWFSQILYRHARQSVHTSGDAFSVIGVESHPVGSGFNGPTNADYGMTISMIKKDFFTSTVQGEIDGLNIIVRQGGTSPSDCAGILANVQTVGTTGFAAAFESTTSVINAGTAALEQAVQSQVGVIDPVTGVFLGFAAIATNDALSDGLRLLSTGTGTWVNFLRFFDSAGVDVFKVDSSGRIILKAASGATPSKTIRALNGSLSVLNDAQTTEILSLGDTGNLTVNGGMSTVNIALTGVATSQSGGILEIGNGTSATATAGAASLPSNPVNFLDIFIGSTGFRIPVYNV